MHVDCHSHILPGVDDGARTLEDSLQMARVAVAQGTNRIFATPHGYTDSYHVDPNVTKDKTYILNAALQAAAIPLQVLPAMELHHFVQRDGHPSTDLSRIAKGEALGLGGYREPRYLLLEFSFEDWPVDVADCLRDLRLAGIQVIVAHPERYVALQKAPDLIDAALDQGAWMQLTTGSILGRFGSAAETLSRVWLEKGYIHIIASDAHGPVTRPPGLQEAYDRIEQEWGLGQSARSCQDYADKVWEAALLERSRQGLD